MTPGHPTGQTVQGESLVLADTTPGRLCFDQVVPGSVTVRSTYRPDRAGSVAYDEGRDYVVDYAHGTVARTAQSRLPNHAMHPLFGLKDFDHTRIPDTSNLPYFAWVDYTTTNGRPWATESVPLGALAGMQAVLAAGGPYRVVGYGDSIMCGGEASEPDLRFANRYGRYLQRQFPQTQVTVEDASIPGYTSTHGIMCWDQYLGKTSPDLVLLGWGMNDHNTVDGNEPAAFRRNLVTLVNMVHERLGADAILLSACPPHDDWHYGTHRMPLYAEMTRLAAAETGVAYADVWGVWQRVLQRKDQSSLLANNINHPNDFGHWLYLQAFIAMHA